MRSIARGYTYKEVGAELFISVKTVETHVSNVLRKMQLLMQRAHAMGCRPPYRLGLPPRVRIAR